MINYNTLSQKVIRKQQEINFRQIKKIQKIKEHIQLIQTYTDDERVLAQCNLILKEIENVD